ncbi:MATE family efflux transporter [Roseibium sp.]|uniref:MATE family efflux transporter n=1 Tax=Roseibium sp. TaxID=1936156 RepID=UPI00326742F7
MAWPLTLKTIMLHGIVVIDAILVSSLGETAVAAMGIASVFGGLLLGILGAFSNGTQIRLAQAFGAADPAALRTGFLCGLLINGCIALAGIGTAFLAGELIVDRVAHSAWIGTEAKNYLSVLLLVFLAEAVALNLSSLFNARGETRVPFLSYLVSLPVNVGVSYILIHGHFGAPEMGVTGAAWGTVVGAVLRLSVLVREARRSGILKAGQKTRQGNVFAAALRRHFLFTLPIAATFASASLANAVATLIYAALSVTEFAALTLMMPWIMVVGAIAMCWAQATGILVAQLIGERRSGSDLDAFLGSAWRAAFGAAVLVSLVYLAVCLLSGRIYPGLNEDTRAALLGFLPVLLLLPFPKVSNAMCGNTLRAGGETVYVMHIFIWSQWAFRLPATALLVLVFDAPVIWIFSLLLFEELVKLLPFHLRLLSGKWKTGRL